MKTKTREKWARNIEFLKDQLDGTLLMLSKPGVNYDDINYELGALRYNILAAALLLTAEKDSKLAAIAEGNLA